MINAPKKFLAAMSATGNLDQYMALGSIAHLFKNAEMEYYAPYHQHVSKHATVPSLETLKTLWGETPPEVLEPHTYYLEYLTERHYKHKLSKAVDDANTLVQENQSEKATVQLIAQLVPELVRGQGTKMMDFKDAYGTVITNYYQQFKLGDEYGIRLGYPIVDEYGGLVAGDILSIAGRPASGKSFLVLRSAHKVWKEQHKAPAFWSLEMNNLISGQRLVALDAGVPLSNLKLQKGQGLTTPQLLKLKEGKEIAENSDVPFYLMDANLSSTVEDMYNFCRHTKPAVLFIDGAYMLKHPNPRLGRFERVAENIELIKQMIAGELGIPVVCSWQLSRDAVKKSQGGKGKGGQVGLEDIGYSDAIGQISSIVLGLLEDETVETMNQKSVSIMKGRNGEVGSFKINWRFNPLMNFDMVEKETEGAMQFV